MRRCLLSHAAHFLTGCYLCYVYEGNLYNVTENDAKMSSAATSEAHKMLKSLGYPICPCGEDEEYSVNFIYTSKDSNNQEKVVCESCINSDQLEDNYYYPLDGSYSYLDAEDQAGWNNLTDNYNKE